LSTTQIKPREQMSFIGTNDTPRDFCHIITAICKPWWVRNHLRYAVEPSYTGSDYGFSTFSSNDQHILAAADCYCFGNRVEIRSYDFNEAYSRNEYDCKPANSRISWITERRYIWS